MRVVALVLVAGAGVISIAGCRLPKSPDTAWPRACSRDVCARIVGTGAAAYRVEVAGPAGTYLHNARLAPAGSAPCAAGQRVAMVDLADAAYTHGPLAIQGTQELQLRFIDDDDTNAFVDLEARVPGGFACVRVPVKSAAVDAGHDG